MPWKPSRAFPKQEEEKGVFLRQLLAREQTQPASCGFIKDRFIYMLAGLWHPALLTSLLETWQLLLAPEHPLGAFEVSSDDTMSVCVPALPASEDTLLFFFFFGNTETGGNR